MSSSACDSESGAEVAPSAAQHFAGWQPSYLERLSWDIAIAWRFFTALRMAHHPRVRERVAWASGIMLSRAAKGSPMSLSIPAASGFVASCEPPPAA